MSSGDLFSPDSEQESCPVCGKPRWERIGPCAMQMACDCAEPLPDGLEEQASGGPVVISIQHGGAHVPFDTGLRGAWTDALGFVIPFASIENAVDVLRVLTRQIERLGAEHD